MRGSEARSINNFGVNRTYDLIHWYPFTRASIDFTFYLINFSNVTKFEEKVSYNVD